MKIRAWQVMKIKGMLNRYEPSEEYFERCLIEMAETSNKPTATIAILRCDNPECGKDYEKIYSEYKSSKNKAAFKEDGYKHFCSEECAIPYMTAKAKHGAELIDKYYKINKISKKYKPT